MSARYRVLVADPHRGGAMRSKIEWTGETWNPIVGCKETSPGCRECYAARVAHRGLSPQHKGLTARYTLADGSKRVTWTGKVRYVRNIATAPIGWRKPRTVLVGSMTDLFYREVPDDWIDEVFAVMLIALLHARRVPHVFQVLTKHPERLADYTNDPRLAVRLGLRAGQLMEDGDTWEDLIWRYVEENGPAHPGLWVGTTIEDQPRADQRIPHLLRARAALRWLSVEPMLGPIALDPAGIDWVACGGESGHRGRPFRADWGRQLRDRCRESGVPFFMRQIGSRPYIAQPDRECFPDEARRMSEVGWLTWPGGRSRLTDRKGGDLADWPDDLRVREFPEVRHG